MNNFDVCSYGIGLEVNIYKDTCGDLFDENIRCLTRDSRHNGYTYFYTDWRGLKAPATIGELVTIKGLQNGEIPDGETLKKLIDVIEECDYYFWNDNDIDDLVKNWKIEQANILHMFNDINIKNLDYVLEQDFTELKNNVAIYETHGYSQGDYARFIIDYNALNEHWETEIKVDSNGQGLHDDDCEAVVSLLNDIEHYFWDCPIRGSITLHYDGESEDIFVDEFLSNEWEWDKDDFITKVIEYTRMRLKDVSPDVMDKLKCDLYSLIPDEPRYL